MNAFERILDLEAGCNFRDLGGYATHDGRRIRSGLLFRSGVMTYFTPRDRERVAGLGIRAICDLRRPLERETEPSHWPDDSIRVLFWDQRPAATTSDEGSMGLCRTPEAAREAMSRLYHDMPLWLEPRLQGVFQCLAEGNVPLVFHCAAGKDRTGLAAALVLHAVGVPRETILEDYRLTNEAVNLEQFLTEHRSAGLGLNDPSHPLVVLPEDVRRLLLAADDSYLETALIRIEEEYESIDNYLEARLGVDRQQREAIKELVLTD